MIALFDEPPRVTIRASTAGVTSRNGLLMGLTTEGGLVGIVCLEDGELTYMHSSLFTVDFRYEVESDRWIDVNVPEPDQE